MTFHLSRLAHPHDAPVVGCVRVDVTDLAGVSPLRWAGLLRCASSRRQRPSVSPLRAARARVRVRLHSDSWLRGARPFLWRSQGAQCLEKIGLLNRRQPRHRRQPTLQFCRIHRTLRKPTTRGHEAKSDTGVAHGVIHHELTRKEPEKGAAGV